MVEGGIKITKLTINAATIVFLCWGGGGASNAAKQSGPRTK